jgi:hypothetical protein
MVSPLCVSDTGILGPIGRDCRLIEVIEPWPAWRFGEAVNFFGCGVIALDSMGCIPLRAVAAYRPLLCAHRPSH